MVNTDSFGTPLNVGDIIAYTDSWRRGSTRLSKSQITSFTKGGNPRVAAYAWLSEAGERAITGWYVKVNSDGMS